MYKPPNNQKNYVIDNIIKNAGHIPLRTPPYMCELNPIELAWAQVKKFIRDRNTSGDFSFSKLREIADEAIASVTPANWDSFCQHVISIENKFWETDYMMEEVEPLIITLTNDSDSDSDTEDSGDDDDNNSDEALGV